MVIKDDGSHPENAQLEITDTEIPPFEIPPANPLKNTDESVWNMFQDMLVSHTQRIKDSVKTDVLDDARVGVSGKSRSGLLGNARIKRSRPDLWCNDTEKINRATSVAKDDTVHLSCHRCIDSSDGLYDSMQWIKLSPNTDSTGRYLVKEVLSDMHDDERRNKVVISLTHTLIIRKARKSHSGSYICKPFTKDQFSQKRMNWTELRKWITEDSRMRYFYHLDVIDFDKAPMVETGGDSDEVKIPSYDMPQENLFIFSKWLPWSACSICDKIGLRQRIGLCVLKKRNSALKVPNDYLNNILDFAKNGLPCQSEFLRVFSGNAWLNRPNEIEFAECFEQCHVSTRRKKRSVISTKEFSKQYEKETKKKKLINIQVGKHLVLKCPGSKILKKPVWMLGSETLSQVRIRKTTNKRVNFDILGSIHFMEMKLNDSGIYSCWIEKKMKKKFEVRVRESQYKETVEYGWMLIVSLLVDFIVFLFLTMIKYWHRRLQVRRKPATNKAKSQEIILMTKSKSQISVDYEK